MAEIVRGTLRWFNATKGYGFIEVKGQAKDTFLHEKDLKKYGRRNLDIRAGTPITFEQETREGKQGPNVVRIVSIGEWGAQEPADDFEAVTLKWFDAKKGFGFVGRNGDLGDAFIHQTAVTESGFDVEDLRRDLSLLVKLGLSKTGNLPEVVAMKLCDQRQAAE